MSLLRVLAISLALAIAAIGCSKKSEIVAQGDVPSDTPLGVPSSPANPVPSDKEFISNVTMPLNLQDFLATKDVDVSKHCFQLVKKKSDGSRYLQIATEVCPAGDALASEESVKAIYEVVLSPGMYNSTQSSYELVDKDTSLEVGNMFIPNSASGPSLFSLCSDTYLDYRGACDVYGDATTKLLSHINAE